MERTDQLQNHSVQAVGTTLMFFALIIFGFVFWKIFGSGGTHLIETQDGARAEYGLLGGEAVSRLP